MKEWLPAIRPTIRPTTFASYEGHVELHLIPALGQIPLQQLSAAQLNAFYAEAPYRESAGKGNGELAPATVTRASTPPCTEPSRTPFAGTRSAATRPMPPIRPGPPLCGESEMKVWSVAELKTFLAAERENALYPLWLTLATTGMRRGEALGLRWQDLDLEARTLSIRQTRVVIGYQPLLSTPKTSKGRRQVALDPATASVCRNSRSEGRRR